MQATAGKAFLRPAQKCRRSASLVEALHRRRAFLRRDGLDDADEMIDLRDGSVELDDQHRRGLSRVAAGLEALGRVDRGAIHHLEAGGNDAF